MKQNLIGQAFEDLREEEMGAIQGSGASANSIMNSNWMTYCTGGTGLTKCFPPITQPTTTYSCITVTVTVSATITVVE